MEGLSELIAGDSPAEATVAAATNRAPGRADGAAVFGTSDFVGARNTQGSSSQVQGFLYAAITSGTLPLVVMLSGLEFDVPYQMLGVLTGLLSYFSLQRFKLMDSWDLRLRGGNGTALLLIWTKMLAGLVLFGFVTGYWKYYALHVLLIWFVAAPMSLVLVSSQLRHSISSGHCSARTRRAVLVFANETARQFALRLKASHSHELLGYFEDRDAARAGNVLADVPRLGSTANIADYVSRNNIDVVFISLPQRDSERALSVAEMLGDTTASLYFVPDFCSISQFGARAIEVNSMPVLEVMETPFYGADGLLKRLFDIAFSLCALIALAPPMLCIAAAIRATSPGPALFLQKRYGLNGKEFCVFKFRTMYTADRSSEIAQVVRHDPRVTPIGHFLRRTSLDELPQFINVLLGDMSVVGPRPHTIVHNEHYRRRIKRYMSRHKVKPGITGLAQVNGLRGETTTVEAMDVRIRYDISYIRNWSLSRDVGIILKTILVFWRDKNAY